MPWPPARPCPIPPAWPTVMRSRKSTACCEQFPESVREQFQRHAIEETPKPDDIAFHRSRWWPLLSNASLVDAAEAEAQRHGFSVEIDNTCDDWDYMRAADYLLKRLREIRARSERVCLISGGEVTVKVTNGGAGGRNQQFALACALRISGENITVLSAGTDGIDGNSPAAGAIVDGSTLERARVPWSRPGCKSGRLRCLSILRVVGRRHHHRPDRKQSA